MIMRERRSRLRFRIGLRAGQARDHRLERDAARRVALRIEEELDIADILAGGLAEIVHRQVVEIRLGQQHRHALVVEVEEILQVGEGIGAAQRLDMSIGEADVVALGEREHQLRLQAALDMDVQLRLRQPRDRCVNARACNRTSEMRIPSPSRGRVRVGATVRSTRLR